MSDSYKQDPPSGRELEVFQPHPDVLYSLDTTAHLSRVSRRAILIYCRAGLVRPVIQPPYGIMLFSDEAIYKVRQIEEARVTHGVSVVWIKTMFDLTDEVERLRTQVRFLQKR